MEIHVVWIYSFHIFSLYFFNLHLVQVPTLLNYKIYKFRQLNFRVIWKKKKRKRRSDRLKVYLYLLTYTYLSIRLNLLLLIIPPFFNRLKLNNKFLYLYFFYVYLCES